MNRWIDILFWLAVFALLLGLILASNAATRLAL